MEKIVRESLLIKKPFMHAFFTSDRKIKLIIHLSLMTYYYGSVHDMRCPFLTIVRWWCPHMSVLVLLDRKVHIVPVNKKREDLILLNFLNTSTFFMYG